MTSSFRPPAGYAPMIPVVLLTLATAIIHLSLGTALFTLNGIGYLVLLVLLYAPIPQLAPFQRYIRIALIAYAALTIVLYIPLGMPLSGLGIITKVIELLLIAALLVEASQARHRSGTVGP